MSNAKRRLLLVAANPSGAPSLRLGAEQKAIQHELRQSASPEAFEVLVEPAATVLDLRRALLLQKPEIVHFYGHGEGAGGILLEDEQGRGHLVSSGALARLFELASEHTHCVVLNACYAELQANEIVQHVSFVVGMQQAIGDEAAIHFATSFYQALFAGKDIPACFNWATNALDLSKVPANGKPTIKRRVRDPHVAPPINDDKPNHPPRRRVPIRWLSIAACCLGLTGALFILRTPTTGTSSAADWGLCGFYLEQKNETVKMDGRFGYRAVGTSLVILRDKPGTSMSAIETTTWEVYYYRDPKNPSARDKVGGYTAEWLYTESNKEAPVGRIAMEGRVIRRLGMEVEGMVAAQLAEPEFRSEYVRQMQELTDSYLSVYSEFELLDNDRVRRSNWYNGKRGEPEEVSVYLRHK